MRTDLKPSTSFDTYQVIKRLVAKGIEESQAEEIVHAIIEGRNTDLAQLATKEQFMEIQNDVVLLRKDFESMKREVTTNLNAMNHTINHAMASKADIEKTKIQLIMWLGGFIAASTSIIFGLLQYFLSR